MTIPRLGFPDAMAVQRDAFDVDPICPKCLAGSPKMRFKQDLSAALVAEDEWILLTCSRCEYVWAMDVHGTT